MIDNDLSKNIPPYELKETLFNLKGYWVMLILRCPNNKNITRFDDEFIYPIFKRFNMLDGLIFDTYFWFKVNELKSYIFDNYSECFVTYESKPALELKYNYGGYYG